MKHIKRINEFWFRGGEPMFKIGDKLKCTKDYGFNGKYEQLPRIYDFKAGYTYEVSNVASKSVTMKSDQESALGSEPATQIFTFEKDDYFPTLSDYFQPKGN